MNLERLKEPFAPDEIDWRVQSSGIKDGRSWARVLAYINARAAMDRLDEVCGPEGWRDEYKPGVDGGVMCGLSIKVAGEWVTKWDGAENTDIEAVKGGLSGAFKRVGVKWGIGRYLYKLPEAYVNHDPSGVFWNAIHDKVTKKAIGEIRWNPPRLPKWAIPKGLSAESPPAGGAHPGEDLTSSEKRTGQPSAESYTEEDIALTVKELAIPFTDEDQKRAFWNRIKNRPKMEQEKIFFALRKFGVDKLPDLLVTKTDAGVEALVVGWTKKAS